MKSLKNHTILFDAECPMCRMYTKAFTTVGMLDKTGAQPYQHMPAEFCPFVDQRRAVNEIALVNHETGEVSYGIHSLFKVLGNSVPLFAPLFAFRPFVWLMTKAYAFVSYNRKVIIPEDRSAGSFALQPDFKLHYRIAYLIFTWFFTGLILTKYAVLLKDAMPVGSPYREYLICGGQVVFQGLIISLVNREKRWEYLGNMMTISFAGALLLLPVVLLSGVFTFPVQFCVLYFLGVAGLMFLEHIRRTGLLGIGYILTMSWVLYRIAVLLWIFLV